MVEPFISVIVATLLRPSLKRLIDSLDTQSLPRKKWEPVKWELDDSMNEYEARNRAVKKSSGEILTFLDDDTYVPNDFLENVAGTFKDAKVKVLTCAIEGDIWGVGKWVRIDKSHLGIGACLSARRDTFESVGGFIMDWGLGRKVKGWRSDSALLYSILERFGLQSYVHISDIAVFHREKMKSKPIPEVEKEFYKRFRPWVLEYIAPNDKHLCRFLVEEGIERDPRSIERLKELGAD